MFFERCSSPNAQYHFSLPIFAYINLEPSVLINFLTLDTSEYSVCDMEIDPILIQCSS